MGFVSYLLLNLAIREIASLTFPPPILSPPLIKVRNFTAAQNINSEFVVLDTIGLAQKWGYSGQQHTVVTSDGYRLKIFRITSNPKLFKYPRRTVVYFHHPLFGSSDIWILRGPKHDLAFMLADAGYDVWIGNNRGNAYGRSHVKLFPDRDKKFWEYSYHDIAVYDLTRNIDYILNVTREKSLIHVGHSQGSTSIFALLSTRPEYNSKIRIALCLTPVTFRRQLMPSLATVMFNMSDEAKSFVENTKIVEILPQSSMNIIIGKNFCKAGSVFQPVCSEFIYQLFGRNKEQLIANKLPTIMSYFPSGASTQCLWHYRQDIKRGNFQAFDYGNKKKNMEKYNQPKPPVYNLKNVVAPIGLFYSYGDALCAPKDAKELESHLPNVAFSEAVPYRNFNHMDFLIGKDVKALLNDRLMQIINTYRNKE